VSHPNTTGGLYRQGLYRFSLPTVECYCNTYSGVHHTVEYRLDTTVVILYAYTLMDTFKADDVERRHRESIEAIGRVGRNTVLCTALIGAVALILNTWVTSLLNGGKQAIDCALGGTALIMMCLVVPTMVITTYMDYKDR
jgi:hypothetical protein